MGRSSEQPKPTEGSEGSSAPVQGLLQVPGGGGLQLLPIDKADLGFPLPGAGSASGHSETSERFSSSQFV